MVPAVMGYGSERNQHKRESRSPPDPGSEPPPLPGSGSDRPAPPGQFNHGPVPVAWLTSPPPQVRLILGGPRHPPPQSPLSAQTVQQYGCP